MTKSAPEVAVVVLHVFSGRPDPSWPLEAEALRAVVERVDIARAHPTKQTLAPPVLGYRGFGIESKEGGALPHSLTVWQGVVVAVEDREVETWADAGDLESFLLVEARRHGHGKLLSALGITDEPDSHAG